MSTTDPVNAMCSRAAASYLGYSEESLRIWRALAIGPRYFKAGKLTRNLVRHK